MTFTVLSCPLDVRTPGTNEQQWIWQQLQLASGPAFLLPGMGPGQAASLPGRPLGARASSRDPGNGGTWCREDSSVHRGGVPHLKGRAGSWVGTALPCGPLLPEGGTDEYSAVEVCPGLGGTAEGLSSPLSRVRRAP